MQGEVSVSHKKREEVGLKVFIEDFTDIKDVYMSIENYNQGILTKFLIMFDDMIAYLINNNKAFTQ